MDSSQAHRGLFSLSLQGFLETLTEEQKNDFKYSTLDDFQTAIDAIQKQQSSVRMMRNLARLKCFLEAIEQFGKVIEVFVNANELVCFIWGPAKFLLQIASAYTEAFDALLDSYQQIGESLPLLSQYQGLFQRNPSMRRVLSLIYNDILEFHKKALKYFRQRTWRQLFHATWKTFRAEFTGLLSNIQRHGRLVESQANLVEFEQLFHQMEMVGAAAKADFEKRTEEDERNRRITVRNWLSAASTDVDQERGVTTRKQSPGSGRWVLDNDQVKAWFNPEFCSAPLLWMNGIPGAGKTVLASLIVEELEKLRKIHPFALGFFYCKHKDTQRSTFNSAARAILAQLLNQNEALLPYLFEKASTSGEVILESPTLTKELLETALKSSEKVYIVIDGLDECDSHEKKAIVMWFQSVIAALADAEFDSIRCLFISQDDGEVGKLLSKIPIIRIRSEDTKVDIRNYAIIWSKRIQEKFDLPDDKRDNILSVVIERANGMFLFAKLVMENLFSQTRQEYLNKELEPGRFPRGLEDAYARIVDRILGDPSTKEDAQRLLGWLVCAKRPLKWREIQCAASIDLQNNKIDLVERQLRVGSKGLCGSLVEQRSDDTVEMVHLTARFFLVSQKYINLASEELELAKLCLGYLNFRCFQVNSPESEIRDFVLTGYYSFLDYAALHWVDHLEEWIPNDNDMEAITSIKNIIEEFLQNFWSKAKYGTATTSEARKTMSKFKGHEFFHLLTEAAFIWKKLQKTYGPDNVDSKDVELVERICRVRTVLEKTFVSSKGNDILERKFVTFYGPELFKCPRISCKHFTDGFTTNENRDHHIQKHKRSFNCIYPGCPFGTLGFNSTRDLNRHFGTAHDARQYGELQFPITQDPGDIDIKRAIRAASVKEVEKWLEQFSNTSVYAPFSKLQRSAILGAVKYGDEHIFKLLLAGTPNINTAEITSLANIALAKGQIPIVYSLLRHPRANPFDISGRYESPITTAIRLGKIEALNLIDDDGTIDWNKPISTKSLSSRGRSEPSTFPLLLAVACRNVEITRLLIGKDRLELNRKDSSGRTPLRIATENKHVEAVELFIEKEGVELDSKDFNGSTSLSCAAANGLLEILSLLVKKEGVDINSKDASGRTPLSWAARNGHLDVVQILIDNGVDMNSTDYVGWTPLSWAAGNGDLKVVQLLIDNNVDMNAKDISGQTPLSWAAGSGHLEVVQLLIDKDVDLDSKDVSDRTPLSWAVENGHLDVVQILIDNGVDMNSTDYVGWTPLSWAAGNGDLKVVQLLIDNNVDMNAQDISGQTPLSWAARNGHLKVVQILIDKDVVVDSKDASDRTPLSWAAENGHLKVVQLLIDKDVDVDSKDASDRTPLSWAAENGHLEVVQLLIDNGVHIDSMDISGRTPLSWAAGNGHLEMVLLLIDKDVDMDSRDVSDQTSLSWAARNGHFNVMQILMDNGADMISTDSIDWTHL